MSKPRKQQKCKTCGHTQFDVNRYTAAGDVSCLRCGTVLEENPIVSEVQFGESSSGAAMVQGAMVGADQARATFAGGRQNAMESREQTLSNGKRKIKRIAAALKIPDYIAEAAGEWFRLALTLNFVQGRRSNNVLATCLYVACRKERTHHMLIDFSSRLQISVYSLGATFLKMVKALHITSLPLADPSLFIQHFVEKLDFKDKATKVAKDAVKLAHRMAADWIHEGRRPAGIAGACVLLAARMNNFRRSHAEIVAVSHVGEETLQRRLNEFKKTKAGELSIKSFREVDNLESSNPPSFEKNRAMELKISKKLQQQQTDNFEDLTKMTEEERNSVFGKLSKEEAQKQLLMNTILSDITITSETLNDQMDRILKMKKTSLENSLYKTPYELALANGSENDPTRIWNINKPRNLVANLPKTDDILQNVSSEVELNSDDDDEIVRESKLTEEEVAIKERIWTGLNHDYLVEQEKKRLKQEADELTGNTSKTSSSNRRKRNKSSLPAELRKELGDIDLDEDGTPRSAADSAKMYISKTSVSKKINYDSLKGLLGGNMGF
ncbi:tanscription factor TFIIIB subunit, putative [Candida dubliniensis CD36]|uniref:Transcription factor IIIB 70 kDa subunit n=1 Tax=Candida dubliniensis (strain CD36 / ATCC MYA-646 / CBS 7987 / NCPF 3949 / NRRL Y-17841) TaxID=573826 RepID=B9WLY9_CANDC|nr:tanscription factor TFIIIB subunit, putative [Candida dubliniensis CD36]CAX40101.1 tanscription factor TFIIIB subunit, putative [Candida dubliniensis CD36]